MRVCKNCFPSLSQLAYDTIDTDAGSPARAPPAPPSNVSVGSTATSESSPARSAEMDALTMTWPSSAPARQSESPHSRFADKRAMSADAADDVYADDAYSDDESESEFDPNIGLLPGWVAVHDEDSDDVYYWNKETGITTWDRPEDPNYSWPADDENGENDGESTHAAQLSLCTSDQSGRNGDDEDGRKRLSIEGKRLLSIVSPRADDAPTATFDDSETRASAGVNQVNTSDAASASAPALPPRLAPHMYDISKFEGPFYPMDELVDQPWPPAIDTTRQEMYLTEEDFFAVFGMRKSSFSKLPKWKRNTLKQQNNLFDRQHASSKYMNEYMMSYYENLYDKAENGCFDVIIYSFYLIMRDYFFLL